MFTIHHVTYDSDGELFTDNTYPVEKLFHGTIAATIANRIWDGWWQTSPNQVAKVDRLGWLDVVTFEEMTQ